MESLVRYICEFLPSVIMLIISLFLTRQERKRSKKAEDHQIQMGKWFARTCKCIRANNKGTLALAEAYQSDNKNGKLTEALDYIKEADLQLSEFVQEMGFENLAKR